MRYSGKVQDAMISGSKLETALSGMINTNEEITVFFGSCIDQTYHGKIAVLERMANKKPDIMVFLGDNVYIDPGYWSAKPDYIGQYNKLLAHQSFKKFINAKKTHFLGYSQIAFKKTVVFFQKTVVFFGKPLSFVGKTTGLFCKNHWFFVKKTIIS